jgi:hypothetical protein
MIDKKSHIKKAKSKKPTQINILEGFPKKIL